MEIGIPVDACEILLELIIRHLVIVGFGVAQLCHALAGLGQTSLYAHDIIGDACCIGLTKTHMRYQLADISHIGLTYLGCLGVLVQIIILLSQGQATLNDAEDIVLGILLVGSDIEAHQSVHALSQHLGPHLLQPVLGNLGRGLITITGQECSHLIQAMLVESDRVHGTVVEVGYLLCHAPLLVLLSSHTLNEFAQLLVVILLKNIKAAISAILIGEWMSLLPSTCGKHIEICSGQISTVQIGQVDTRLLTGFSVGLTGSQNCCESHRVQHNLNLHRL